MAGPTVAMRTYRSGAISGWVGAAGSPRRPVTGLCVDAVPVAGGVVGSLERGQGTAGPSGFYRIAGLAPGRYKVFVGDPNCNTDPGHLVPQWYRNTSRVSKAIVVTVAAGRTTRLIRVMLEQDGSISGTVTERKPTDKPLAGICVQVVPVGPDATPYLAESIAPNGDYLIDPLPPGKYRVEFEADCAVRGYATQWWQGATSVSDATPVTVRADRTSSGIDASMTPTG